MIPRTNKGVFTENELLMYLSIGLKHFRLMVLLGCLALAGGLAYYNFVRPVYASVSLISYQTLVREIDTQTAFRDSSDLVILSQLRSSHIMERTAKRFGINSTARDINKRY